MMLGGGSGGQEETAAKPQENTKSRLSFMFSCEDIMVDSTSVLKESET